MNITDTFSNAELPQLVKLERVCFPYSTWNRNTFLRFREWYRWRVVRVKNRIIGYIIVELTSGKQPPEIVGVCVHPDYQGLGIASDLMQWAEDFVLGQEYDIIKLLVRNDNSAYFLYFNRGYRAIKILKNYYDDAHAIVMVKNLMKV